MFPIKNVEGILDLKDIGLVESRSFVGFSVKFRFDGLGLLSATHVVMMINI